MFRYRDQIVVHVRLTCSDFRSKTTRRPSSEAPGRHVSVSRKFRQYREAGDGRSVSAPPPIRLLSGTVCRQSCGELRCEPWSVIHKHISAGKSALAAQRSSAEHPAMVHFAALTRCTSNSYARHSRDDCGRKAVRAIAIDGPGPRPPPHDPSSRQICVLGDLHGHGCPLQPMNPPKATRPVARPPPGLWNDMLIFLVAQLIW